MFPLLAFLTVISSNQPTVDRGDYVIGYESMGKGVPILALPGGPGFGGRSLWSFGYELRDTSRVILFDQLGTGKSQLKDGSKSLDTYLSLDNTIGDLEALRKHLGYKRWSVFGQSWGVMVAIAYAARYPQSVDRLILASVPGFGHFAQETLNTNLDRATPLAVRDKILAIVGDTNISESEKTNQIVGHMMPYYFFDPEEGLEYSKKLQSGLFNPLVFASLYKFVSSETHFRPIAKTLKTWKGKALIIQGHQDPTGGAQGYIVKERFLPSAKVVMLDSSGHFSWMEKANIDSFFHILRVWMGFALLPHHLEDDWRQPLAKKAMDERFKAGWPFGT